MSSMAERLRARSEKRPMYMLDESDDEFLLPVSGSKGKKKEDGKKRDKDDSFVETEKIEKFVRDDAKEDACQKCGQPDKLVSCAACTYNFHKKCLFPPYKSIDDKWICSECDPRLKEMEKILDCEVRAVEDDAEGSSSEEKQKHYLVKWKGLAYIHCTWIPESEFTKSALFYPRLKQRLNTFHRHFESVDKADDEWVAIRPEWTSVDRIIASRKREDVVEYLVKWNELTHDECTWEAEADISAFKPQIERFHLIQSRRKKKFSGKTKSIIRDMHAIEESPKFLPGGKLHPYQLEGLNFLRFSWLNNRRVILGDEMGLGKTIQSIAFLASLHEDNLGPSLVVAPLSTLRNWEREFATWAPHMNVVMYAGAGTSRETIRKYEFYYPKDNSKDKLKKNINKKKKAASPINESKQSRLKFDVLLTSYEMINMDSTSLKPIQWECMIVDEGHRLKNKDSKLFGQLKDYNTNHRVLLTGTPIQNNLDELFMLMHFLEGESFGSIAELQEEFSDINQDKQIEKLHGMLKPHLLRRFKKDVMKELPPKKELILRVELTNKQKEYYKAILTRNYQVLARRGGGPQISLINVVMELRKLCCHAFMLEGVEPETEAANPDEGLRRHFDAAGKMELLDKMMVKLKEQGHRVLIYSQFQHMLDLLEDYLASRKWSYERIDGKIPGAERQIRIDRFNAKNSTRFCFLLSTRAGGLGINLATADTVIIYDSDWNPHADLQAMARAHRLGQTSKVMIYRLVSRGTIEERMMQLTKKKMVLEHLVVGRLKAQAVNQEELDDIIRHGSKELFGDDGDEEGKAKHIHYDDIAIDRLLDRDQIIAEEQLEEDDESDFLKGFKVASFEFVDEAKAAAAREESRRQAEKASRANYWEELLKDKFEVQKVEEHTSMGKGKRSRKQMAATDDDGLAQEISSEDEDYADDDDGSDNDADAQGGSRRGAYSRKKSRDPHPLMEGEGKSLRVLGFNLNQRNNFMQILMRFGFQDFQWQEFIPRLKGKSDSEIKDYAALVMQHLLEPLSDSPTFSDGVPKDQYRVDDVLVRLANLQLIEEKVKLMSGKPSDSLFPDYVYNEYPSLMSGSNWKKEHDLALLTAFTKHGYARYVPIVEDRENGIAECASKELNLTIPSVNGSSSANGTQSGDVASSSNGNVDASKANQVGPEYHYHYAQRKMVDFIRKRYQILEKAMNLEYAVVTAKIPIPEPDTQPRNQEVHLQPPSVSTTSSLVNELPVLEPISVGNSASESKTEQAEAVKLYNKMSRIVHESDADAVQAHMGDKNACARLGNSLNNLEAVCGDVCEVLEETKPGSVHSCETPVQVGDNEVAVAAEVKAEVQQVGDGAETKASEVINEPPQVSDSAGADASKVKSVGAPDDAENGPVPMEE